MNIPGKKVDVTVEFPGFSGRPAFFSVVPLDSKLGSSNLIGSYASIGGGNTRCVLSFVPDKGGIYKIECGPTITTVVVAEKLSREVHPQSGRNPSASATVVLYLDNGYVAPTTVAVEGENTPRIEIQDRRFKSQLAALALNDPNVLSAVIALSGRSAAEVNSTFWPALQAAWTTAIEQPTANPGEDPGAAVLLSQGWNKEN
jgi:hypothetical protein